MKETMAGISLENYFSIFREQIIGIEQCIPTPEHPSVKMVYADWTASGRCYWPIETELLTRYMPLIANTHTETSYAGAFTSQAYSSARATIKRHVNADAADVLIMTGSGTTAAVNKLQRLLGLRLHGRKMHRSPAAASQRPVVLITHMEHHSNHTSWLETMAEVVVVPPGDDGRVSVDRFAEALAEYEDRLLKIAAVTACSNVTGIVTPYHDIARLMHQHGGYCFVDFAASAPYVDIDMHPPDALGDLDAIYFSPHKFLGGPGSAGVLILNKELLDSPVPDNSGGGTVEWTNPWGGRRYVADAELREDGGTPPILQTIKAALAIGLKEEMGVERIRLREQELLDMLWERLTDIPGLSILGGNVRDRLPVVSFTVDGVHYNEVVKQLNDRFGIQCRGGCSCAGTYGHFLLHIGPEQSKRLTDMIDAGDCSQKPGWVRLSFHPTMTSREVCFVADSVKSIAGARRF